MRRRHFPLLMLCLYGFLFLWCAMDFRHVDDAARASGYFSMLYSLPTINTVVFPLFLAVLASRIWDTEHKGNTLIGTLLFAVTACFECLLILFFGKKLAFTQPLPVTHLVCFFVTTFLTGTCIYLFQEILSFFFDNQIIPLAIGLIGSFFGLFSLFFSETFAQFVIWSYFCQLATVHINWDPAARTVSYLESPLSTGHLLVVLILLVLACIIGTALFERKDV